MAEHALSAASLAARITALEQQARGFHVRGTYDPAQAYQRLDVVACGGSSFVARCDQPGPCPGKNWQLLASRGKRGPRGRDWRSNMDDDDVHAFNVELAAFHAEAAKLRAHMARVKAEFDHHMAESRKLFDAEMTQAREELRAEYRAAHARLDRLLPLIKVPDAAA